MSDDTNYSSGVRGFLEWLDEQQPGISAKVKAKLPHKVPDAFSAFNSGGYRTSGMGHAAALAATARHTLGAALGDITDLTLTPSQLSPVDTSAITNIDVTQAADTGQTSTGITDTIASVVKGISSLYLTKQQADIQQQVVNTQLARAAAGLPPLPTSLANLGVPQVSVGLSAGTGTMIAVGGGLFLLYLLFGGGRRRA